MECKASLSCLQEPATGLNPEPDESSPHHTFPSYFPKIHSNTILPSTPPSFSASGFLIKILYTLLISLMCATYPAHLILLDFITLIIFGEV